MKLSAITTEDMYAAERCKTVKKHLQEVRHGAHLELFNDPEDGWELMANGDAPHIHLESDMETLALLLRELESSYRMLTGILGNPASAENRKRISLLSDSQGLLT